MKFLGRAHDRWVVLCFVKKKTPNAYGFCGQEFRQWGGLSLLHNVWGVTGKPQSLGLISEG